MSNTSSQSFTIGELSRTFSVTPRTIRFYEEKGYLSPERKGNKRIFSIADKVKLKLILRGKRLGFSLQESNDIISMYDPAQGNEDQYRSLLNKIHEKRQQIEDQLQDINAMMSDLEEAETKISAALDKKN